MSKVFSYDRKSCSIGPRLFFLASNSLKEKFGQNLTRLVEFLDTDSNGIIMSYLRLRWIMLAGIS